MLANSIPQGTRKLHVLLLLLFALGYQLGSHARVRWGSYCASVHLESRGRILACQHHWLEARQRFRAAVVADPSRGQAWLALSRSCERLGDLDAARDALEMGLCHVPDDPGLRRESDRLSGPWIISQVGEAKCS